MSMLLAKPPAGGKLFIHHDQLAPITTAISPSTKIIARDPAPQLAAMDCPGLFARSSDQTVEQFHF